MEIKITSEDLIGTLTREHHFDTHRLDDACQKIHGRRGADCRYIVGFDEIDDVADGIESFLNGVVDFVMHGSDMISNEFGLCQIRRAFQSYGK